MWTYSESQGIVLSYSYFINNIQMQFQSRLKNYENKSTLRVPILNAISQPVPQFAISILERQSMATRTTYRCASCAIMEIPLFQIVSFFFYIYWLSCVCTHVEIRQLLEVRQQLLEVNSLLPCGFWGSNSSHHAWRQAPSPAEPSCWAKSYRLFI